MSPIRTLLNVCVSLTLPAVICSSIGSKEETSHQGRHPTLAYCGHNSDDRMSSKIGPAATAGGKTAKASEFYTLRPIASHRHFGAEVMNVDMSTADLTDGDFIARLKNDLRDRRVLLFRNQNLSGRRQVDISDALGRVESTFYRHPKSPHPDIFRVSNNEEEGCTNVGRSGWHVDGTFMMTPFMFQTMHFPSVSEGGDTYFVPLRELYDCAPKAMQSRWDKLWMVTGRRQAPVHPLVYQHPFRNETTMLFHCGEPFVRGWLQDEEHDGDNTDSDTADTNRHSRRVNLTRMIPPGTIQRELTDFIETKLDDLGLRMRWERGDFMINDNLGLAHFASEGTQKDWHEVGLRILHRTTIIGGPETIPRKADGRMSFTMM